jgi:hypothetical protein
VGRFGAAPGQGKAQILGLISSPKRFTLQSGYNINEKKRQSHIRQLRRKTSGLRSGRNFWRTKKRSPNSMIAFALSDVVCPW